MMSHTTTDPLDGAAAAAAEAEEDEEEEKDGELGPWLLVEVWEVWGVCCLPVPEAELPERERSSSSACGFTGRKAQQ